MLPRNANLPKKGRTILPFKDMSFRSASLSTPPAFQGLFVVLALVLAVVASIEAATYTVDAPGKLATIATQIQAASGSADKVHHVRFKTYQEVGNFTLTALTADSLIFERDSESAEVIEFSGKLFKMENVTAAVVFRNLAFKAKNGAAIFHEASSGSPNRNLLLDSCQLFGDTLGGTFLSWLGDTASKVDIKRSYIVATRGTANTKLDLNVGTVSVSQSYLNVPGVLVATTERRFELTQTTVNRMQFQLNGNFNGLYAFSNNLFAHPPVQNRLSAGGAQKFVMSMLGFASGTATQNARFSTWAGSDYPASAAFPGATNPTLAPFGDSLALWDFRQAGEMVRGYQNPAGAFPAYNIFPGDTALSVRLSGKDSAVVSFAAASIPRAVSVAYGTTSYPVATDSTRTYWLQDTTLALTGPASVRSVRLQGGVSSGLPLLFARSGADFVPGSTGAEGSLQFSTGTPSAKVFIPAFAGQNTPKGSNVAVKGLSSDTVFIFSNITRSGRTSFSKPTLAPSNARWRTLQKAGNPVGLRDTTNAEGNGLITFGLSKSEADSPYATDSLTWWLGGASFVATTDSASKYWGRVPFAPSIQAVLIERLTIGKGADTLLLAQGRIVTRSGWGHQLRIDSTHAISQSDFPDMGAFSKGISFTWPGRGTGDSCTLTWNKSNKQQHVYLKDGTAATLLSPTKEDSTSLTLSFGIGDSGKVVFLARKWRIAAGVKTDLAYGKDSVLQLLSSTPGDLAVDSTGLTSDGLPLASTRFLGGRKLSPENLTVQGTFTLRFEGRTAFTPDSIHAYVLSNGRWTETSVPKTGGRYAFTLGTGQTEVALLEGLPIFRPAHSPTVAAGSGSLTITPNLTAPEKERVTGFAVELISIGLDGLIRKDTSRFLPPDSTAQITLSESRIYAYRVDYQILSGRENADTAWALPPNRKLSGKILDGVPKLQGRKTWRLVGFPYDGSLNVHLRDGIQNRNDSTLSLLLRWSGVRYDTLASTDSQNPVLRRGEGYCFVSTESFVPKVAASDSLDLKTFSMDVDGEGWKFLTSPYPFPYPIRRIKTEGGVRISRAMTLRDTLNAENHADYYWQPVDTLKPFEGYALYVFGKTKLTFEPLPILNPAPAAKGAGGRGNIQITAFGQSGFSRVFLESGSGSSSLPYLPTPSSSLGIDIGGKLLRALPSLSRVEETLVLHSSRAGVANLKAEGSESGAALDFALFDPQSGEIHALSQGARVQLQAGGNTFQLIAGDKEYVAAKTAGLAASLPRVMSLSQNFPNPFKGFTEVRYTVPAGYGRVLKGRLEVMDLSGRIVQSVDLGAPGIGRHAAVIGATGRHAGTYVYRLFIRTSERSLSMQQRMIVLR